MIQLFRNSYYFWVISRLVFCVAIFTSLVLQKFDKQWDVILSVFVCAVYLILMVILLIQEIAKIEKNVIVTKSTGILSLVLGFIIGYLILYVSSVNTALAIPFFIWIILMGMFDLYNLSLIRNTEEY
jgi:hypothetical protein